MTDARFDDVVHPRHRLQICAILVEVEAIDFAGVRETLDISESSLSKHIRYLSDAGYLTVEKLPNGRRTRTWLSLTEVGRAAYDGHLAELRRIIGA